MVNCKLPLNNGNNKNFSFPPSGMCENVSMKSHGEIRDVRKRMGGRGSGGPEPGGLDMV